jgi:hypothetical protein
MAASVALIGFVTVIFVLIGGTAGAV